MYKIKLVSEIRARGYAVFVGVRKDTETGVFDVIKNSVNHLDRNWEPRFRANGGDSVGNRTYPTFAAALAAAIDYTAEEEVFEAVFAQAEETVV